MKWIKSNFISLTEEAKGKTLDGFLAKELYADYLQAVHSDAYDEEHILYMAYFGRNGKIWWELFTDWDGGGNYRHITVQWIGRNQDELEAPKGEAMGEGARAIASLYNKYPDVNTILYDDESRGFWTAIGGGADDLYRQDFFAYYNRKLTDIWNEANKGKESVGTKWIKSNQIVFNEESVGAPWYDAMLGDKPFEGGGGYKNLKEYYEKAKGFKSEVVYMTPDEYLSKIEYDEPNPRKMEALRDAVAKGEIIDMPYLDYTSGLMQEGRHRANLAKEMGIDRIPVMVIENA